MKIVYKPLDPNNKSTTKTTTQKGKFDDMLSNHLKQARGEAPQVPDQQAKVENEVEDTDQSWETLRNLDAEYYKKGVNKKTLAETFSARNNSDLKTRINKYKHLIEAKAKKYNLDPNLLAGLVRQESNFNPYAVSHCGAMGLGQVMPETARYLGIKDPFNAAQNLDACAKYLKEQLNTFGGNVDKALAAYNAGPGAVKKFGGIPPYNETRNYVRSIRSHRVEIKKLDLFTDNRTKKV